MLNVTMQNEVLISPCPTLPSRMPSKWNVRVSSNNICSQQHPSSTLHHCPHRHLSSTPAPLPLAVPQQYPSQQHTPQQRTSQQRPNSTPPISTPAAPLQHPATPQQHPNSTPRCFAAALLPGAPQQHQRVRVSVGQQNGDAGRHLGERGSSMGK